MGILRVSVGVAHPYRDNDMTKEQMEKFSDIGVVRAAIERNQVEIRIANKQIAWAAQDKIKINRANELLRQTANEWTFELMVSLSHRRFCRLMGFK